MITGSFFYTSNNKRKEHTLIRYHWLQLILVAQILKNKIKISFMSDFRQNTSTSLHELIP